MKRIFSSFIFCSLFTFELNAYAQEITNQISRSNETETVKKQEYWDHFTTFKTYIMTRFLLFEQSPVF